MVKSIFRDVKLADSASAHRAKVVQFSVSLDNFAREEVITYRSVLENDFKATMKLLRKQKFNRFEKPFPLMFQFYCKILFQGIEKTEL